MGLAPLGGRGVFCQGEGEGCRGAVRLQSTRGGEGESVSAFTEEERFCAMVKGKKNTCVGLDGVPHELLHELCQHEQGRQRLLAWFNGML